MPRRRARGPVGCGVDLPQDYAGLSGRRDETEEVDEAERASQRRRLSERGASFRRRHRLHGPFVLYGGRIDPGKGCEELIEYFGSYVGIGGEASLVLMGVKLMPRPEEPFIRFAVRLSDEERLHALEAAART